MRIRWFAKEDLDGFFGLAAWGLLQLENGLRASGSSFYTLGATAFQKIPALHGIFPLGMEGVLKEVIKEQMLFLFRSLAGDLPRQGTTVAGR